MKNFKWVKYLPLLYLFFTFNSSASVLDSNSAVVTNSPDKAVWNHSFHVWRTRDDSLSVYSADAIAMIDSLVPADRSVQGSINNTSSQNSTTALLVDVIVQLSIDIFVQYSVGMNDYKNLLTGIDTTVISQNGDFKGTTRQSDLTVSLQETYSRLGIKNLDSSDVSTVPLPHAIWLFITGFMAIIWSHKKKI